MIWDRMLVRLSSFVLLFAVLASSVAISVKRDLSLLTSLPRDDSNSTLRALGIVTKRAGWLYGPPLIGNTSFFPTGSLATVRIDSDLAAYELDSNYIGSNITTDTALVEAAIVTNGGLNTLDDYTNVLYNNEWRASIPGGEDPGMLTNYTQDLLFSMSRLSLNPFPLNRVKPTDTLPFTLSPSIVKTLTGTTLQNLQSSGRLFIVDHSPQLLLNKSSRYGAACTAYFYIHPSTRDFLPLAIKTNVGANLTYTPLDSPEDWLLAKIMFNVNDVFHADLYHLVATHDVGEIVHLAAMRTLSDDHPVLVLLDRLMNQAYAVRPVGSQVLFNSGGAIDQAFYISSTGALQFATTHYPTAGKYTSNYLSTLLSSNGLIPSSSSPGPALKSFPFLNDASLISATIREFMRRFVESYYPTLSDITGDWELQSWFLEASSTGEAQVLDFPTLTQLNSTDGKEVLIDLLTHFAYLTGVLHHALNTGSLASQWTLPFVPLSLYAPVPTSKNVTDLMPFLPPAPNALFHLDLLTAFNRPEYASRNKTLVHAFDDAAFLGRFKDEVVDAAGRFKAEMEGISRGISARSFDDGGLSLGMPFVWKGLDPGVVPWFFAI